MDSTKKKIRSQFKPQIKATKHRNMPNIDFEYTISNSWASFLNICVIRSEKSGVWFEFFKNVFSVFHSVVILFKNEFHSINLWFGSDWISILASMNWFLNELFCRFLLLPGFFFLFVCKFLPRFLLNLLLPRFVFVKRRH